MRTPSASKSGSDGARASILWWSKVSSTGTCRVLFALLLGTVHAALLAVSIPIFPLGGSAAGGHAQLGTRLGVCGVPLALPAS